MAKGFKLQISRMITSFKSCRSKDPSTLPKDPVPSFLRFFPLNPELITADFSLNRPASNTHSPHASIKRHVSSNLVSCGCGSNSRPGATKASHHERSGSRHFKWQKEEKWHVVANIHDEKPRRKIYNTSASGESDDDVSAFAPPPPPPTMVMRRKKIFKKKKMSSRHCMSTSSADDSGWFSSDERGEAEESETLLSSSRSFSTDSSSEYNPHLETIREAPMSRRHKRSSKKKPPVTKQKERRTTSCSSPENETPARLSMFKKLIPCSVEGKVKESFAIVKKSDDPYEDFKRSMMEMILEKQMFEKNDLEQLLQCFLSLNSRCYHGVIIEAFSDIWKALFSATSTPYSSLCSLVSS